MVGKDEETEKDERNDRLSKCKDMASWKGIIVGTYQPFVCMTSQNGLIGETYQPLVCKGEENKA